MPITVDFDSNPRTIYAVAGSTVNVRFVDKSTTTNGVINSWLWKFGDNYTWIPDGSTNPTWIDISGASITIFQVNDRVAFYSPGALPGSLSASVLYWVTTVQSLGGYTIITVSTTQGGSAVTANGGGSGSGYTIQHGSDQQNPIASYGGITSGTRDITLTCNDSGSTGNTSTTKTAWIKIEAGTFTPPLQTTAYRNISIFVYERSTEPSPKSTCICRAPTDSCNLFFQNLQVQGAITKAGKSTFDIVNNGTASSTEIDLFESGTGTKYKNIAIVAGYDVIWSGKITRADKELRSQPYTTPQKCVYHCEAYTDVKKLSDWNIKTPVSEVGKTPGQIVTDILAVNTGEPDFIGTKGGFIDPSGTQLQMTLSDTDKLTAFSQLTNATDYDWRTRMETMLFQYQTFNGSNLVYIVSDGLTAHALIGQWILFPTDNYLDATVLTPNMQGVMAWGLITENTATVITATITGAASIPTLLDTCLIVNIPRMDFSSDLQEPTAIRIFTNNVDCVQFKNADDKVDLFTKVTVRGKDDITGKTESSGLAAVTPWISASNMFTDATPITFQTDTYLVQQPTTADLSHLFVSGWHLAWKVGDSIQVVKRNDLYISHWNWTITALSEQVYGGEQVTYVTITTLPFAPTIDLTNALVCIERVYVKNKADVGWISGGPSPTIRIGSEIIYASSTGSGTDSLYGDYLAYTVGTGTYDSRKVTDNNVNAHLPGTLVWKSSSYNETSPGAGSAVKDHGIINKDVQAAPNTSKADFEVVASNALIQGSQYYQKSTMVASYYQWTVNRVRDGVQLTKPTMIREGQRVSIIPYTGATAIERQIVIWDFDANSMRVSLQLGDYQKDVFNTIDKNTAASQKALI